MWCTIGHSEMMLFCLSSLTHRTSGHRNRNHGPSGQPSGRASHSATEIRGDWSHSLAFSSLKYYIAHQKSFGSSVATAPDQYLKSHGAFLLRRGSRCDCTSRRSPCAFFSPSPPLLWHKEAFTEERVLESNHPCDDPKVFFLICLWFKSLHAPKCKLQFICLLFSF